MDPQLGDLVEFRYGQVGIRRGYVRRIFRSSGALTVYGLVPNARGRDYHVQPDELLAVHPDVRRHDQPRLM